jgi:hypothetical protein
MNESGGEKLYVTTVKKPLVNLGVSVLASGSNALIDPWLLGSKDERDVQGYAGTPVDQNDLTFDYLLDVGAAGTVFPRQQQFYVAVDSGSDRFTGAGLPGRYVIRSWKNDVTPPRLKVLTTRVGAGRPTLVARVLDSQSGVDPLSLVIGYRRVLVGAVLYDPFSGLALFPLPRQAARIPVGKTAATFAASDYQESKNVETIGNNIMPNTTFRSVTLRGVRGPAVTWLTPRSRQCVSKTTPLAVVASSTRRVLSVRFGVDGRRLSVDRKGPGGLFVGSWHVGKNRRGRHVLSALATDAAGKRLSAVRPVRVCR